MKLSAVLFDLDDTLHDKAATLERFSELQHREAGLAARGVSLSAWQRRYLALNRTRIEKAEVFALLAAEFALPAAVQAALLADFDARLGQFALPCPGAAELLAGCRAAGLKVGVVTNGRDAFQRSKIAGMGLQPLVDAIVTSGGFGRKKPDPAIFLACLAALDTAPDSAAFVGDDFAADMMPALQLGMRAIWKSQAPSDQVAFSSAGLGDVLAHLRGVIGAAPSTPTVEAASGRCAAA